MYAFGGVIGVQRLTCGMRKARDPVLVRSKRPMSFNFARRRKAYVYPKCLPRQ